MLREPEEDLVEQVEQPSQYLQQSIHHQPRFLCKVAVGCLLQERLMRMLNHLFVLPLQLEILSGMAYLFPENSWPTNGSMDLPLSSP